MIGVFAAIAMILHLFDFPVPFAPSFYKLDFSEIPALIGAFAFGPVAGVMIEFCKVLLKLLVKGTTTAFVGDLANFVVGCSFILPASIIYFFKKTKASAIIASIVGTLTMTVFGTTFNAIYLLPAFSKLYGMPLDAIIGMGTAINSSINSVTTLVVFAVAPLNLIKGGSVSLVTILVYKKLSPILKEGTIRKKDAVAETVK
jgi:riboflavin transporter FmnP